MFAELCLVVFVKVLDVFQTQREIASCSERRAVRSYVCAAQTGVVITLIKQSCCKNPDRVSAAPCS